MKRQALESAVEEGEAEDIVKGFCDHYEEKFLEIQELLKSINIDRLDNINDALSIAEDCASDLY